MGSTSWRGTCATSKPAAASVTRGRQAIETALAEAGLHAPNPSKVCNTILWVVNSYFGLCLLVADTLGITYAI